MSYLKHLLTKVFDIIKRKNKQNIFFDNINLSSSVRFCLLLQFRASALEGSHALGHSSNAAIAFTIKTYIRQLPKDNNELQSIILAKTFRCLFYHNKLNFSVTKLFTKRRQTKSQLRIIMTNYKIVNVLISLIKFLNFRNDMCSVQVLH